MQHSRGKYDPKNQQNAIQDECKHYRKPKPENGINGRQKSQKKKYINLGKNNLGHKYNNFNNATRGRRGKTKQTKSNKQMNKNKSGKQ